MSVHKRRVVLSPEARGDLSDILLYTEQQWGRAQQRSYGAQINAALAQLARYPDLGILRPEYGPQTRSRRVGQHIAIYESFNAEIVILRILHPRRDQEAEFD